MAGPILPWTIRYEEPVKRLFPLAAAAAAAAVLACSSANRSGAPDASLASADGSCPRYRLPQHSPTTVYQWNQVDREAKARRNNPDIPWPSGVDERLGYAYISRVADVTQAEIELRFVVDSAGCADPYSVKTVASTDSAFTLAVVDALHTQRFEPAVKDGETVAQLVQWKWVLYKRSGARIP